MSEACQALRYDYQFAFHYLQTAYFRLSFENFWISAFKERHFPRKVKYWRHKLPGTGFPFGSVSWNHIFIRLFSHLKVWVYFNHNNIIKPLIFKQSSQMYKNTLVKCSCVEWSFKLIEINTNTDGALESDTQSVLAENNVYKTTSYLLQKGKIPLRHDCGSKI